MISNPARVSRPLPVRTSASHPLLIDELPAGQGGGRIGLTICPGKKGLSHRGYRWDRDLEADLDAVAAWRPAAVVSLVEDDEARQLGVPGLGAAMRARGLAWFHLPIRDVSTPCVRFEARWAEAGPRLLDLLRSGQRVLVHCQGGLGRAGTVSARLLVELGATPGEAIRRVRAARPHAIETSEQEAYVRRLAAARHRPGDWFEALTGFPEATGEGGCDATRQRLTVEGHTLRSLVNGRAWHIGELELVSLGTLRERARETHHLGLPNRLRLVTADVADLHAEESSAGAMFQVASQFNLLEMVGPDVTPEQGVARYAQDPTQGPACAVAAGAATIYRNYFAPVGGVPGQTASRQFDGFAELGDTLARAIGRPARELWTMKNGYALFRREGLEAMSAQVASMSEPQRDGLRRLLRIGLHCDVEVTRDGAAPGQRVSQAFCSALPVAYSGLGPGAAWAPLATLVLEAAYEATLWAAALNAGHGGSRTVFLTLLGGGAFGNDRAWIRAAIKRAVRTVGPRGLDIVMVGREGPSAEFASWWSGL